MPNNNDDILHIPISARYKIVDGKAVMVSAVYEDIPARRIAEFLLDRFGVPWERKEEKP